MGEDAEFDTPVALAASGVASRGYAIVPGFLGPLAVAGLAARALALDAAGGMRPAGIGSTRSRIERREIRGDRIAWLGATPEDEQEALLFEALESLRRAMNRSLQLGLFEFEGHYAIYPPGAAYARHRDVFRGEAEVPGSRVLSCVLYLNVGWRSNDGGELTLYLDNGGAVQVTPDAGTLAAFLSSRFDHEVGVARRERISVTGWFRRRPSLPLDG